jgi:hypothetical protein
VSKALSFLLLLGFAVPSQAQVPVAPTEIATVKQTIDSHEKINSLNCFVDPWGPSLDFNFRYQSGFEAAVNMKQLTPSEQINAYLRITPDRGSPVFLQNPIDIPAMPKDSGATFQSRNRRRFQLTGSGTFSVGEGKYSVELLLLDAGGRSCYQRWKAQTGKYPDKSVPGAMRAGAVEPVKPVSWNGKLDANGLRVSVLLDAAPVNPLATRLHASDRAFSLAALATLLRELPCQSVQIVAFNLDRQRDVFRQQNFDADGFAKLTDALQSLEFSSVPVEALKRGNNLEYLRRLAREQLASGQFDAVVFLGPNLQTTDKNPQIQGTRASSTHFFYFEEYGSALVGPRPEAGRYTRVLETDTPFPDSIEYLTKELHGSVFHIISAKDLALAIPKMLAQLKVSQSGESSLPGH